MKKIGIALGGGGVRGLAHVLVLEVFDQLGLRPALITGTSIGAIVGAAYASGVPAAEMRALCLRHIVTRKDRLGDVIGKRAHLRIWLNAFGLETGRGGLLSPERMFGYLFKGLRVRTFEQLRIPLRVIAADYWAASEALRASCAFPGVFAPAVVDGRVLVDGGMVNNVPYDHLRDSCDLVIAVDVAGTRQSEHETVPGFIDSIVGAFNIMQEAEMTRRLSRAPPDIYVHPRIHNTRAFDFTRIETVFEQAAPAVARFRQELERALAA
jgi:NTE family protein